MPNPSDRQHIHQQTTKPKQKHNLFLWRTEIITLNANIQQMLMWIDERLTHVTVSAYATQPIFIVRG